MKQKIIISLTTFFFIACLSTFISAQEQADERDENKRDFAAHGEIDYRNVNLWENRLPPTPPHFPPDYDSYTNKVVYAANIGIKDMKSEIFMADMGIYKDEKGNVHGIPNLKTQKRLTWNGSENYVNVDPFFTRERKIAYTSVDTKKEKEEYFLIDDTSKKKKRKISRKESDRLYLEVHKNGQIVVPPPK